MRRKGFPYPDPASGAYIPDDAGDPGEWVISDERLRNVRGSLVGPWPTRFTPQYIGEPPAVRAEIRRVYKSLGYTHFAIGPTNDGTRNYDGPTVHTNYLREPGAFEDLLQELVEDDLIPLVFMVSDRNFNVQRGQAGSRGNPLDFDYMTSVLRPIFERPRMQTYCKYICSAWEPNDKDWWDGSMWARVHRFLRDVLPKARLAIHMTANHSAPSNLGDGELAGWNRMRGLVDSFFWQSATPFGWFVDDAPAGMTREAIFKYDIWDFKRRFEQGYAGWPTGIDLIAFEYCAYVAYNRGVEPQRILDRSPDGYVTVSFTHEECRRWGAIALAAGAKGFCDGGPVG